ncbi:hypothetical protein [Desulfatitalea alkaliphila]|uniref:Uncharacterized protein n=1 Tax=Desulfatitalea alkaliphila TaxID=2929485 RepID=A0AA41R3A3_9BACT|nr:hypothetical protein [Desulfatitalea alkaliphila]MCJ8502144.1 hypothetical protein [Desulfatitalea alkaliphila]
MIRPKHRGMLTLILALALLLVGAGYYWGGGWQTPINTKDRAARGPLPSTELWVPGAAQLDTMQSLAVRLPELAQPSPTAPEGPPLVLFGQGVPAGDDGQGDGRIKALDGIYHLNLTMMAGPLRYCLLNDRLYAEGDPLPDGSEIVKIAHHGVLLAKGEETRWVLLPEDASPEPGSDHERHAGNGKGHS